MPKPVANLVPPALLQDVQAWFSKIRYAPEADHLTEWRGEAHQYVTASKSMSSQERLEVYVQDYWPRCLNSLADDFPGLLKYLGRTGFNKVMTGYLEKFPSRSYTLYLLPDRLVEYLFHHYHEEDRNCVIQFAQYEWARAQTRFLPAESWFKPERMSDLEKEHLPSRKFDFQPHAFLIKLDYDLPGWLDSDEDEPPRRLIPLVVYRSESGETAEDVLDPVQFDIFIGLNNGFTLSGAIDLATIGMNDNQLAEIETKIPNWFSMAVASKIWTK